MTTGKVLVAGHRERQGDSAVASLVTGGGGFIGRHLVRQLLARGDAVRVVDKAEIEDLDERAEFVRGSVLDQGLMRDALGGVDRLFHLAANPDLWSADKSSFYAINYEGTRTVLEAARRSGVARVVYTSTESILKSRRHRRNFGPIDETIELTVEDMPGPYCRSKFLAEQAAMAAASDGLPIVIVNPTLPVGPGDFRLTPPTQMILDFLNGDNPAYIDCEFNMVDVRLAALGHILAAERGRIGERYILGGENLRLSQILDMLGQITGLPMPARRIPYAVALVTAAVSEFVSDHITRRPPRASLTGVRLAGSPMIFDCSKAVRELGLPYASVRAALVDAVEWLVSRGLVRRRMPTATSILAARGSES